MSNMTKECIAQLNKSMINIKIIENIKSKSKNINFIDEPRNGIKYAEISINENEDIEECISNYIIHIIESEYATNSSITKISLYKNIEYKEDEIEIKLKIEYDLDGYSSVEDKSIETTKTLSWPDFLQPLGVSYPKELTEVKIIIKIKI